MSARHSTDLIRAVAYYRMSSSGQEASVPEQREWADDATRREGVNIVREFEDLGISGSELDRRPGFQDMLRYCDDQAGAGAPIEAVVVWNSDRFSRADSIRTAAVIDRLMEAGVTRMLCNEGWIDWDNEIDRAMYGLKQEFTKRAYAKAVGENAARSALSRARKGLWVAGRPPYAYVVGPDGHLLPGDPAMAETVRWIFHRYATSADSLGDLTRRLIERGDPPPPARRRKRDGVALGGEWNRYAVWMILHNRAYLGELVWNAIGQGKYFRVKSGAVTPAAPGRRNKPRRTKNAPSERIVVPGAHPALTDPATFDACRRKLEASRWKRTTPQKGGGEWVLSGVVHCADCGGRMVGRTSTYKRGERTYTYRRYVCNTAFLKGPGACHRNGASQEVILREVALLLRESFTDPKRVAELRDRVERLAGEQDGNREADRRKLRDRLAGLDRQIAESGEGLARNLGKLPQDVIDDIVARLAGWKEEKGRVAAELRRLEEAAAEGAGFVRRVSEALEGVKRLEEILLSAPASEARDALAGLVEKITLHFERRHPRKNGTYEAALCELEVDLQPEAAHLLGMGGRT